MKRDEIKKAIREEWEAGGISFKALAEKHGIPEGTLKSWAKREGWEKCNRNPDATESETVATESKDATEFSRYNWEELRRKFITGDYSSLNDFARQHGFGGNNGFFARASKGWIHEKKHYEQKKSRELAEETLRKTAEKASEDFPTSLSRLPRRCWRFTKRIRLSSAILSQSCIRRQISL